MLIGMQGDGATDKARWIKYIAFGPCANPRGIRNSDFYFSKGCNCLLLPLHSPNLLVFIKKNPSF